jgi:hypothetical protein
VDSIATDGDMMGRKKKEEEEEEEEEEAEQHSHQEVQHSNYSILSIPT